MVKELINNKKQVYLDLLGYTYDPLGFVLYSFKWGEGSLTDCRPEEWQMDILIEIGNRLKSGLITKQEAIQIAVASGHGIGKSSLVSWIILWSLTTCVDTRGVVTANTEVQLRTKTWAELSKWYQMFVGKDLFKFTATAIFSSDKRHEKTWRFDQIPWSEHRTESFAGMHNKGRRIVVIMDEASAIADKIWEVTEGALTDEDTEILWIAFGNPTRNTGRFRDCFGMQKHRWIHKQIDSRKVTITNKDQINKWVEDYGEDSDFIRVRVRGVFPSASDHQFIPSSLVEEARHRFYTPDKYSFAPKIIGVDRAWSGDDTVFYLRQGLVARKLARFNKGEDDVIVAGHLARLEDEEQADAVFIDFGYGTGVFSIGKQMGRKWQMVSFGSNPIDAKYAYKRDELWGLMKDWLQGGGAIPDDDDICNDLIGPEAFSVQTGPRAGKIKLESKEDMRKRSIPSPDDGDSLAITFAFPVKNRAQRSFDVAINLQQKEFDPLEINRNNEQKIFNPNSPLAQPLNNKATSSWRQLMTKG